MEANKARQWHNEQVARRDAANDWLETEERRRAAESILEAEIDEQAIRQETNNND